MCHSGCDTLRAPASQKTRDTSQAPCDTLEVLNLVFGGGQVEHHVTCVLLLAGQSSADVHNWSAAWLLVSS